jgi:hypothetical protein
LRTRAATFALRAALVIAAIQINSGERWNFLYEVVAENASPIRFVLEFFIDNDEVKVVKVI